MKNVTLIPTWKLSLKTGDINVVMYEWYLLLEENTLIRLPKHFFYIHNRYKTKIGRLRQIKQFLCSVKLYEKYYKWSILAEQASLKVVH